MEQKLLTLPEHMSSPPVFSGVRVTRSLVLYVCFVDRCLSVYLSFFFWPLCCLSFFDIRILITPLVPSNSSFSVWHNKHAFIDNRILRGINIARLEWNNIYMWRSDKNEVKITLYYINLNHYYDDGIGILSSPACSSVNIIYNFYYALRYRRSHDHRH